MRVARRLRLFQFISIFLVALRFIWVYTAYIETKQHRIIYAVETETIYLDIDQLVERWGGSPKRNTLAIWRMRGVGPTWVKAGKQVLYPLLAVVAYELENTSTVDKMESRGQDE